MKKLIAVLLAAALLSGCAAETVQTTANAEQPEGGQRPTVEAQNLSLAYDPTASRNPYTCANETNALLFGLMYQGLFSVDENYAVHPQLCKSYTVSQDKKTWTFALEEATFSDGTLLSAADVVASLEAARAGQVYKGRFGNVQSISQTADGGVEIVMATAYENLPLLLTVPIVLASQVNDELPDGTGPYYLQTVLSGEQLWLRQDWWCRATLPIHAEKIPLVAVSSPRELRDEFELGDVGAACTNPASVNYVDFRGNFDLWDCENGVFLYLGCRAKSKVFGNENVRRALTYAIDRDTLVREYYRTFAQAATLPASPSSPYYSKHLAANYGYKPGALHSVLEQESLLESSVTLLVNKADSHRVKVANAIAEMLNDCGLTVTVKALSGENYTNALRWGNFDLHLGQTKLSPNMDLSPFFDRDGTLAYGGMSNTTLSALCKDALGNSGNYEALHQAVMDSGMLCPVAFLSNAVYLRRDLVDGLSPARDNVFYYTVEK